MKAAKKKTYAKHGGFSCSGLLTGQDKSEDLAAPASSGAGQPRQISGL